MWESFVQLILTNLKKAGINIKRPSRLYLIITIWLKKILRKPVDAFSSLAQLDPYASAGLPILKKFLSFNKKSLRKLQSFTSGKRIIVLIDDLDRANPVLVPQLLFAIKELLDLPSMVFVLAFDPVVINKVLYSNRNDEGQDYLDKIIDFPKWLPKLTDKDLLKLLQTESYKYLPFLDFDYIQQVFHHLDKNPRKLKQWIRIFVGFEDEIKRYNKEEINWAVFLLVNIVKIKFPQIFVQIFSDDTIWKDLFTERWLGRSQTSAKQELPYLLKIKEISTENHLSKIEENILVALIEEIVKLDKSYTSESFLSYAHLTERPAVITWKEFNEVLVNYEDNTSIDALNTLLNPLIKNSDYTETEILSGFIIKAIEYWNWALGQASNSVPGDKTKSHATDAVLSLKLIENICFDKNGFSGATPFLDVTHFTLIYKTATKWIDFTTPAEVYIPIREKEKQVLVKICKETSFNLNEILFFLKPWNVFRNGVYNQEAEKELAGELSIILEKRIALEIIYNFKVDNWINSIFEQDGHFVEHYILLRKTSHLWSPKLRQQFLELLDNNEAQKIISNNMYQLLSLIDAAFFSRESLNGIISLENSILSDKELIIAIWKCAFIEEINPRMFKEIEELKNELKSKCDIDVPSPLWWERIKRLVESIERK